MVHKMKKIFKILGGYGNHAARPLINEQISPYFVEKSTQIKYKQMGSPTRKTPIMTSRTAQVDQHDEPCCLNAVLLYI